MPQQYDNLKLATEDESDRLAARVREMFDQDPVLQQLGTALAEAKNALHSRQNELMQAAKEELGIEGETTFEYIVWEGQAGIC